MRKILLLAFTVPVCILHAQTPFTKSANDALVVAVMVQKFHVQPKAVDDAFSTSVYTRLINQLDRQKIFFTTEDLQLLAPYKDKLDDEIRKKQTGFLQQLTTIYQKRMAQADTMIDNICRQPFNFNLNEKTTVVEDTSYASEASLRNKVYKLAKRSVLLSLVESNAKLLSLTPPQQKKFIDSAEAVLRKKINTSFKRSIQRKLQSPGGLQQMVGTEYCKTIATCFDPHTEYMPLNEKEDFESALGRKAMGFGFKLDEDENGHVKIDNLKAGSPAFKSGQLNEGDKMESIQWEGKEPIDVSSATMEEVMRILDASNHDNMQLKVRKADGSTRLVTLWKEQLQADEEDEEKVRSYILNGSKKIGYISLPAFYEDWENEDGANVNGCANDVAKEILKLKKENIEGLVLDVRYNGGGSMREAVELAGIFIDAGPVAMLKTREQKPFTLKDANRGTIYDGPLMLLVNGYSASASEMLAGTLQDYNRAVIVGTPTYGKATGQVVLPMDTTISLDKDFRDIKSSSYIKTTISQLYRINGTTAQASGVKPDVFVPDLLEAIPGREGDDPFVIRAVSIEGNKYYKAGSALPIIPLQVAAKAKIEALPYFKAVQSYVDATRKSKQRKDMSLRLSDALSMAREQEPETPEMEDEKQAEAYQVINNDYELQRMKTNANLKEVNEDWKETLSKDPYVKLAYELMLLMIK
jgi:carboxyl-terminal processing protease